MEVPSICPCGNDETVLQDQGKGCEGFYFVLGQILQRKCEQDDEHARASSTRERYIPANTTRILETQTVRDNAADFETVDNRANNLIVKANPITNNTVPAPPPLQTQSSFNAATSKTVPTANIAAAVAQFHSSGQTLRSIRDDKENARLARRKHSSLPRTRSIRRSNESMCSSPGSAGGYQGDPDSSSGEDHKSMMEEALKKRIPAVYGASEQADAEDAEDWKE